MLPINYLKSVLSIFMLASLIVFSTCTKVEVIDPENTENTGDESLLLGKWEISDKNATYGSFEFTNDKKYIVTQRVTTKAAEDNPGGNPVYIIIIFGDYTSLQQDGNTYNLDLKEFGIITITISDGSATITINGETYIGNKTEPIDISERTELLSHTWNFRNEKTINCWLGSPNPNNPYEIIETLDYSFINIVEGTITFTSDGTYIEQLDSEISEPTIDSDKIYIPYRDGTWEWTKDNKLKIGISWYNYIYDDTGKIVQTLFGINYQEYDISKLTESELFFTGTSDRDIHRTSWETSEHKYTCTR
ncbi:MAG: DUF4488 domain-containing protein [Tannerellaceae bacterium]|jgi:hypothetical protein|nr:DUF4488 domain-containing protein [Tannerellaceae bacterium]